MMNSSNLAFDFKDSKEMLQNLLEEFEDFKINSLKSRYAMNCVINSWHLTDWTFHDYFSNDLIFQDEEKIDKKGCKKVISGLLKYQQYTKKNCPELEYMHLIANGVKHCRLRNTNIDQKIVHHKGEFTNEFSREFNISRFIIVLGNNDSLDFYTTLEKTIEYWKGVLKAF